MEDYETAVEFVRGLGLTELESHSRGDGAEVTILDAGRAMLELSSSAQLASIDDVKGRGVAPSLGVAFEVPDARFATEAAVIAGAETAPVETP